MSQSKSTSRSIVIIGSGGFGREVRDLAADASIEVVGFLDHNPIMHPHLHAPVLGTPESQRELDVPFVVAVGAPLTKSKLIKLATAAGRWGAEHIAHPSAVIGREVFIAAGTVITAGCIITTNVLIGSHVVINLGSTVGHDAVIGDRVSIMPGVRVSGAVTLGSGVFVGTNAVVLEGVTVGDDATIGAGAVVNKDVAPGVTVVGIPAKPLGRAVNSPSRPTDRDVRVNPRAND